jgi:hypothetical protein
MSHSCNCFLFNIGIIEIQRIPFILENVRVLDQVVGTEVMVIILFYIIHFFEISTYVIICSYGE